MHRRRGMTSSQVTADMKRTAERAVERICAEQIERLAALEPEEIPLLLPPELAERFGKDAVVLLRREVSRLCRELVGADEVEAA